MNELFSEKLVEAMKKKGISFRKLEYLTGIDIAALSRYAKGTTVPSTAHITVLAEALDVNSSWLLGETDCSMPIPRHFPDSLFELYSLLSPDGRKELERYAASLLSNMKKPSFDDIFHTDSLPICGRRLGRLLLNEGLRIMDTTHNGDSVSFSISLEEFFKRDVAGLERKVQRLMRSSVESLLEMKFTIGIFGMKEHREPLFKNICIDYDKCFCTCDMSVLALQWIKQFFSNPRLKPWDCMNTTT